MRSSQKKWIKPLMILSTAMLFQYAACAPATNGTVVLAAVLAAGATALFSFLGLRTLARS